MPDIRGNPSPGNFEHPSGVGRGSVVRIGSFKSRGYGHNGTPGVRKVGRYRSRGYGASTPGSIRKIGRYRNRAN